MEDRVSNLPSKKKVTYQSLRECKVGSRAVVCPLDHPNVPVGSPARTTIVQNFNQMTGVAETANTRYEPGPSAEWTDMGQATPSEFTDGLDGKRSPMPSVFAGINNVAYEPDRKTNFARMPSAWDLQERRLKSKGP